MDVKDAIRVAKAYVQEVYDGEQLTNLGLEEVEYHERGNYWSITVGFSRPWNAERDKSRAQGVLEQLGALSPLKRSYKIVTINSHGAPIAMKNREVVQAK